MSLKTSDGGVSKAPVQDFFDAIDILRTTARQVQESETDFDELEKRVLQERVELQSRYDAEDGKLLVQLNKIRTARRILRDASNAEKPTIGSTKITQRQMHRMKSLRRSVVADALDALVKDKDSRAFQTQDLYDMIATMTGMQLNDGIRNRISQHLWALRKDGVIRKDQEKRRGWWEYVPSKRIELEAKNDEATA